jgi:uncharacterized protein (TIGR02145 family)
MHMKHPIQGILFFSAVLFTAILIAPGCTEEDGYYGTLKDKEGNTYATVVIGEQVWMAENLKATKYGDQSAIDGVMAYQDDENTVATYGRLYTYEAAVKGGEDKKGRVQGACPKGWHIPTDEEWKTMEGYLGMPSVDVELMAWRGTIEGGMLKEAGTDHWSAPNAEATNSSGFTALPAGSFNAGLGYTSQGLAAYFWTSSNISEYEAWSRVLQHIGGSIGRYPSGKDLGFSVRCVRN